MGPLIHRKTITLTLILLLWAIRLYAATSSGQVSWIYDGDTLKVDGVGKVRLIGIDSPERNASPRDGYYLKHYHIQPERLRDISEQALAFNIQSIKGRLVRLEFDLVQQDKFGRTLAYVYLTDGTLLNRLLIEKGLAFCYRRFNFRMKQDFLDAEKQARQKNLGLWAP